MATYNPSVYDDAYTVLKKICNVEKWLKDHPQLAIGKTSVELWNDDELVEVAKNTIVSGVDLSIGDVILVDHYILDGELDGTKLFQITAEDDTKYYGQIIGEMQRGPQGLEGPRGPAGADGADGVGVPTGGTTGQVLKKRSSTDYDTEWAADAGGMVNPMIAAGDLITGGASGTPQRLALGSEGQILEAGNGAAVWANKPTVDQQVNDQSANAVSNAAITQYVDSIESVLDGTKLDDVFEAQGDIVIAGSSATAKRLAKGTAGQVLTMNAGATEPEWQTPSSGGMSNPMTAAGDLITGGSSGTPQRLALGSEGQILEAGNGAAVWANKPTVDQQVNDQSANAVSNAAITQYVDSIESVLDGTKLDDVFEAQGDIVIAGNNAAAKRLAKGTAGQVLTMNAGATEPEWQTPSGGGGGASIGVGYTLSFGSASFGEFAFTALILCNYNGVYGWHIFSYDAGGLTAAGNSVDGTTIPYGNRNDRVFTNASIICFLAVDSNHDDSLSNYAFKLYDGTAVTDTNAINKLSFMTEDVEIDTVD